ncbi:MAG: hypothetical protein JNJ94_02460 [Chlorobi bacterium]|nr:hypothetical protein [Chlorobiota bacterium]
MQRSYPLCRLVVMACSVVASFFCGANLAVSQTAETAVGTGANCVPAAIATQRTPPLPTPLPGDVLTPNTRRNTPNLKIALKAGFNRSAYSNDVYLDNVPLDVGKVSGQADIYSVAAGFGYQLGVDVEFPLNTGFSIVTSAEYVHSSFGGAGAVSEPATTSRGDTVLAGSAHKFTATVGYLRWGGAAKLDFSTFYLLFGLNAANAISSSLERTRSFGNGSSLLYPGTNRNTIQESGEVPELINLHYAFRIGAGLTYPISQNWNFLPELTLDFGMNAINKSPNSDLGIYSLSATLQYQLR